MLYYCILVFFFLEPFFFLFEEDELVEVIELLEEIDEETEETLPEPEEDCGGREADGGMRGVVSVMFLIALSKQPDARI